LSVSRSVYVLQHSLCGCASVDLVISPPAPCATDMQRCIQKCPGASCSCFTTTDHPPCMCLWHVVRWTCGVPVRPVCCQLVVAGVALHISCAHSDAATGTSAHSIVRIQWLWMQDAAQQVGSAPVCPKSQKKVPNMPVCPWPFRQEGCGLLLACLLVEHVPLSCGSRRQNSW
jgi:hypothetical protein